MGVILDNFSWMSFNISLAILPVIFSYLLVRSTFLPLRIFYAFIWLIFLPNTIYTLTDIIHYIEQLEHIHPLFIIPLTIQYGLFFTLGVVTYIVALYPIRMMMRKTKHNAIYMNLVYIFNFLIGFGVMLGRIERINSWDIISHPGKLTLAMTHALTSVEFVLLSVSFGIWCNLFYHMLGKKFLNMIDKIY